MTVHRNTIARGTGVVAVIRNFQTPGFSDGGDFFARKVAEI